MPTKSKILWRTIFKHYLNFTELLEQARDIFKYNQNFISAFESNSTAIKIMNNPRLLHSLPITITTYSNVLLRSITNGNLYEIETYNHPVQKSYSTDLNVSRYLHTYNSCTSI